MQRCIPVLALLVCAPALAGRGEAPPLGRLFFTPAERAAIERAAERPPQPPAAEAPVQPRRLDGIVSRRDGRHVLFVDGVPIEDGEHGIRRVDDASAALPGADGRRHVLAVGESLPAPAGPEGGR